MVQSLRPELIPGASEFEKVEVTQYLPLSQNLQAADLPRLNQLLKGKTYLVGDALTLADAAIYDAIAAQLGGGDEKNRATVLKKNENLAGYLARLSPVFGDNLVTSSAATPAPSAQAVDAKKPKKEKPAKTQEPAPEAKTTDAADTGDALDPSKLDIRVGKVIKCWNHPESEKLLCEEIDVGEGSVRTIASGLRAHYAAEEVQGRHVLVLANLKERPMAGFPSQGMVLCACSEDHSVVRLLQPPEGAVAGDRVTFAGFSGEPATPAHVAKKKILEKLAPQVTDVIMNKLTFLLSYLFYCYYYLLSIASNGCRGRRMLGRQEIYYR